MINNLNTIRLTIKFTMENEVNDQLSLLDIMGNLSNETIKTSVYRKPTHTGQYINHSSIHSLVTKRGIVRNLYNRAISISNNADSLEQELANITPDLQQNGYPLKLIEDIK